MSLFPMLCRLVSVSNRVRGGGPIGVLAVSLFPMLCRLVSVSNSVVGVGKQLVCWL